MLGFIKGAKCWPLAPEALRHPQGPDALFGLFENQDDPTKLLITAVGKPDVNILEIAEHVIHIQPPETWRNETDDEPFVQTMRSSASAVGAPIMVLTANKQQEVFNFTLWCPKGMSPQTALFQLQKKIREQQQKTK